MDDNKTEALVFIPPLATLLADAKAAKGSPLREPEVERIRDAAYCQWMPAAEAAEMESFRGFREVEPENCWADRHRMRISMIGSGQHPRIILSLPGGPDFLSAVLPILEADGIEYPWR